ASQPAAAQAPILEVTNARIGYGGDDVIDGLDVSARPGELIAVTGPNGAGKSTLLRGLAGYQPMECDSYTIGGRPTTPSSPDHHELTYAVMDEWMWLRGLTIRDHFEVFFEEESITTPTEALEIFGVADLADRVPYSLSSGQQRRAALASILVRPWRILFIDEPEQRLDSDFQGILGRVLHHHMGKRAVIAATHAPQLLGEVSATITLASGT
ncbi:MAG: ABC transporter ATP-binding protein, partial [Ancrocorticia sp.]